METDISRILIHRDELAEEIAGVYRDTPEGLTLIPVLSGALVFTADLIRELPLRMKLAMLQCSTYPGRATVAHEPQFVLTPEREVLGRHILIVDDILDTGRTLRRVQEWCAENGALSVRTVVLLRKRLPTPAMTSVDFVGFEVENTFVVGYGLDFDDLYRNYPHIGELRQESRT
jgi:hypoxanthine phosphoribosyltransferase